MCAALYCSGMVCNMCFPEQQGLGDLLLQLFDTLGYRGLGQVQGFGCPLKVLLSDDGIQSL